MTGKILPVMQHQLVQGGVVSTLVTHAEMTALDQAGNAPTHGTEGDTKAQCERGLERPADPGFTIEMLAEHVGQPELMRRCLRIGVDLPEAGEDEADELIAGFCCALRLSRLRASACMCIFHHCGSFFLAAGAIRCREFSRPSAAEVYPPSAALLVLR
jgi:hypothetical protein